MSPILRNVILNGASRHRLSKGFLLLQRNGQPVTLEIRLKVLEETNRYLKSQSNFTDFHVETRPGATSVIGLVTPFLPVYTPSDRDFFISSLVKAIQLLSQVSSQYRVILIPAGVNPLSIDGQGQMSALCSDVHQIEVYDDGEIERIYNLFRQFLPELLCISTHSSVYGSIPQKDYSLRMRMNPSSFLPRYLSQFSVEHLDRIKSMLRRSFGLADLTQMDINPLAGDSSKLSKINSAILTQQPAAIELRFVDSQIAYPFIRAQIILFQAIAMYGRSLARRGKRLPFMRDEIIDENKALVIQNGPGAILVPDEKFKKDDSNKGFSYHDKGKPERATTALLMTIDGLLLPCFRDLNCEFREIAPIIIGAELRKLGRQCFANYADYQKYLHYTYKGDFNKHFYEQSQKMLTTPDLDPITDYNRERYGEITAEIEQTWTEKFKPLLSERIQGKVIHFNREKGIGHIKVIDQPDIFFRIEDVSKESMFRDDSLVSLIIEKTSHGLRAVQIEVLDSASMPPSRPRSNHFRQKGIVKWFNKEKHFGYINVINGNEVFFHQSDSKDLEEIKPKQKVTFEIVDSPKGQKAIRVMLGEDD